MIGLVLIFKVKLKKAKILRFDKQLWDKWLWLKENYSSWEDSYAFLLKIYQAIQNGQNKYVFYYIQLNLMCVIEKVGLAYVDYLLANSSSISQKLSNNH